LGTGVNKMEKVYGNNLDIMNKTDGGNVTFATDDEKQNKADNIVGVYIQRKE
jgi:hypothetical protein